jgi:hypothetical protein
MTVEELKDVIVYLQGRIEELEEKNYVNARKNL